MRVFAAVLLGISLMASPLLARNANETGKEDTPAAATSASAVPDKPTPVKPEASAIESEVQDLRALVEEQRAELEAQRAALKAEQLKMEAMEKKMGVTEPPAAVVAEPEPASSPAITSTAAISSASSSAAALGAPVAKASSLMSPQKPEESPLFFKIGGAEFYPLGFMDLTGIYRSTNLGGIGTSFGSIPYNNTFPGRLSELRFSAQNSRIGLRTQAKFGEASVTGYLEADFLGYQPANANDTSNSNSLRMRLYWVDYRRGMWEVFGGQSWSFMTPNRNGLSALPGDLFYGQEMDTNYLLGLTWARQPAFRIIAHPTTSWSLGVSIENPEQTLPSSVTEPANLTSTANNFQEFDSNSGNTSSATGVNNPNTPNLAPDVIVKTAFDFVPGGHHVHFDFAGLFRTFKAINLVQSTISGSTVTAAGTVTNTIHGGGGEVGMNVELFKNFRVIGTGYWSSGGGRYIASTGGPDFIIRPDGTLSGVHSGSAIGGFEYQVRPNSMIYGYYSGAYFGKNFSAVTAGTPPVTTFSGYGQPGSASSANRYLYEPTFGVVQTMWRNPAYGDLKIITQYSYVSRTPWVVAAGQPSTAHTSMVYVDLRYDLP
ncbi:MAG TPA: hypothetical protein VKT71_02935 [Candidatus Acidoferrales bacterium]|nr:hypothetical protein [Candidatus Acidoferrales bacterium]